MLRLVYEDGGRRKTFDLLEGSYVIGRRPTCSLVLADGSVSSEHVRIDVRANVVEYRDLDSRNGTFVNDVRSDAGCIHEGDRFRLGKFGFDVVHGAGPRDSGAFDLDSPDGEATPEAAPAVPEARQVMVLPPSPATGGMLTRPDDWAEAKPMPPPRNVKRLVLAAVAAVAVLALSAVLLLARPSTPPTPPGPPADEPSARPVGYWDRVREGIDAFDEKSYDRARTRWNEADAAQAAAGTGKYRAARVFADAAERILAVNEGRAGGMDWTTLQQRALEVAEDELEAESFAMRLAGWLRLAAEQEAACRAAEQAIRAADFDAAAQAFAKVSPDSPFSGRARAGREHLEMARANAARDRAARLAGERDYEGAIASANEALAVGNPEDKERDGELRERIVVWRDLARLKALEEDFLAAEANGPEAIRRALDVTYAQFPAEYAAARGLDTRRDLYLRLLFQDELKRGFEEWNEAVFQKLLDDPRSANEPEATRYRVYLDTYKAARAAWDEAWETQDFDRMNQQAEAVLALPLPEGHPFRKWAEEARIGDGNSVAMWLGTVSQAIELGDYGEARHRLYRAQMAGDIPDLSELPDRTRKLEQDIAKSNRSIDSLEAKGLFDRAERVKAERDEQTAELAEVNRALERHPEYIRLRGLVFAEGRRRYNEAIRKAKIDPYAFREGMQAARECFLFSERDRVSQEWLVRIQQRYREETGTDITRPTNR